MKNKAGQTLIEVLLATSVTTLLLVVLLAVITKAIHNSQFSKNKAIASKYVEEGLEVARKTRDRAQTWEDFYENFAAGTYVLPQDGVFILSSCTDQTTANIEDLFTRCAVFKDDGDNKKQIEIIVYWTDGSGAHVTKSQTYLTNWQ